MGYLSIATAVAAAVCGLIAAHYWYKSSAVEFSPDWAFEPVIEELKNIGRFAAIMKGVAISSKLNGLAARWTAASVIFSVFSVIAGAWK
jgi:hypothetical protein